MLGRRRLALRPAGFAAILRAEIAAATDEAKAFGRYVLAHAYTPEAITRAVNNGVRTIEHGNLIDAKSAKLLKSKGGYMVANLVTYFIMKERAAQFGMTADMLAKNDIVLDGALRSLEICKEAGAAPDAIIDGAHSFRARCHTAVTLTSIERRNISSDSSSTPTTSVMPALLTRMPTPPKWSTVVATIRSRSSGSVTSAVTTRVPGNPPASCSRRSTRTPSPRPRRRSRAAHGRTAHRAPTTRRSRSRPVRRGGRATADHRPDRSRSSRESPTFQQHDGAVEHMKNPRDLSKKRHSM